jgi:hypothetical protein
MANKKAQVTIFIILALVIAAGIVIGFFVYRNYYSEAPEAINFNGYIEKCAEDAVSQTAAIVVKNGGIVNPTLSTLYRGEKYTYLCYNQNNYLPCINQNPMLLSAINADIKKETEKTINACFNERKKFLESKGYSVYGDELNYSLKLESKKISATILKRVDMSKGGTSRQFRQLDVEVLTPLYDLANIAYEIVNAEASNCYFDYNSYMLMYPDYSITKTNYEYSKLYTITERASNAEFKFAVRSCALPGGL